MPLSMAFPFKVSTPGLPPPPSESPASFKSFLIRTNSSQGGHSGLTVLIWSVRALAFLGSSDRNSNFEHPGKSRNSNLQFNLEVNWKLLKKFLH